MDEQTIVCNTLIMIVDSCLAIYSATIYFAHNRRRQRKTKKSSGRKPGERVLIPPGYVHPEKGTH